MIFLCVILAFVGLSSGDAPQQYRTIYRSTRVHREATRVCTDPDPCNLAPDSGKCYAYIERYYYDKVSRSCKLFIYGGCGGNENNFETEKECRKACAEKKTCWEKPETGLCRAAMPKFYYDPTTGTCKKFIYGGCGGNGNRYETESECLKNCRGPVEKTCREKPKTGPCRAAITKFYYDPSTGTCKTFIYGGCGGNENRYDTEAECLRNCRKKTCHEEPESGPCKAYIPSFYYNATTRTCKKFIYGGCGGNGNRYETEVECLQNCRKKTCLEKPESGPCLAYIPSFYYDRTTRTCKKFIYGGCGGNGNRYETEAECLQNCRKKTCTEKPETGPCNAYIPSFYYNATTRTCKKFIYGGCGGNGNRYETEADCLQNCRKKTCLEEPETGPCAAVIISFYYDPVDGTCKEFSYGGCYGNGNRYDSVSQCLQNCKGVRLRPVCLLEKSSGFGHNSLRRFYFNRNAGKCLPFRYRGGGGNRNNFKTLAQCRRVCKYRLHSSRRH